jgi:hypothetical protein
VGQRHALAALPLAKRPDIHSTKGSVEPRAGLTIAENLALTGIYQCLSTRTSCYNYAASKNLILIARGIIK